MQALYKHGKQFGGVDPGVDVLPPLLGERPLEGAPALVF